MRIMIIKVVANFFADTAKRRYAMSGTSSLPKASTIKDCVDSGRIGINTCDDQSQGKANQSGSLNVTNVTNAEDGGDSPLSVRIEGIGKVPSESEDEAVNEKTTLLENSGTNVRTVTSKVVCHPEMVKVSITNSSEDLSMDLVDDEACCKLVGSQEQSDRLDTAL